MLVRREVWVGEPMMEVSIVPEFVSAQRREHSALMPAQPSGGSAGVTMSTDILSWPQYFGLASMIDAFHDPRQGLAMLS